jgi:Cytochrome P460
MKIATSGLLLISLAIGAGSIVGSLARAESNRVVFPEKLDQMVHYATVKRGNVTEHMLTTRQAIEAYKKGEPAPSGTHFVLVDYRDSKLYRYFVMEKGDNWGADYDERRRTANWQFQWFWPDKSINMNENTTRCQSCHQGRQDQDYLYTAHRIREFQGTPIE